jgi:hypothetical protein
VPLPSPHAPGTAGFADGAGLYRKTDDPLPPFPVGGVMFIGNNNDAEGTYDQTLSERRPRFLQLSVSWTISAQAASAPFAKGEVPRQ